MSDLINAVEILQNILKSPHVSEISNAIRQQQPPRPNTSEVAVDDEMRRLFSSSRGAASNVNVPSASFESSNVTVRDTPRFTTRQYFSSWASKPRKRSVKQRHTTFNKDLVLLPRTSWCTVCKHATRTALHDSGNIISGFEINKTWDKKTIEREVRNNFKDKIPVDVSMEFLMPCGNKLVAPKLQEGQELNGMLIFKIFRSKTIYIRPSRSLVFDSGDSDDSCVELDCDSPESMDQSIANEDFADGMTTRARKNQASATRQMPNFEGMAVTTVNETATSQISHGETIINQTTAVQPSSSDFNAACSLNQNASSTNDSGYAAYLSIIPTVSDVSSDDEELNRAILASIESCNMDRIDGPPAKVILQDLSSKIDRNKQCRFNINRASVLDGAMRGFKRLSYDPNHSIYVKFSDDMGNYEEAVDLGGPRREFLKLLMEALVQSPIFEGQEHQQNLALDSTALREDRYYVAGLAIAVSLLHGGPSPGFLSPTLFNCLVNGLESANPTIDDIADTDLYEKIKKISECSTLHDLLVDTEPLRDYLANAGCLRPLRRIEDRDVLVKDILMFQVIHRLRGPFERFRDGLRTLGVLDAIQKHPGSFRPLLCHAPVPLTARTMEDLFSIRLSPQGSNRRVAEETVVPFWRDYLEDVEEEGGSTKLGNILAFATGADTIPPVGFSPQPSIEFLPKDAPSTARLLPMANTCINCMKLPLHVSYQAFKESMEFALGNTQGFGRE